VKTLAVLAFAAIAAVSAVISATLLKQLPGNSGRSATNGASQMHRDDAAKRREFEQLMIDKGFTPKEALKIVADFYLRRPEWIDSFMERSRKSLAEHRQRQN
jgi:hypothetical protein